MNKKYFGLVGLVLLISSCDISFSSTTDNSSNTTSGSLDTTSTTSDTLTTSTTSSSEPQKEISLIPEVGEVRLLFDHGVPGESQFYNYCPSIFIEDNVQHVY